MLYPCYYNKGVKPVHLLYDTYVVFAPPLYN